jgi:hypothetical protein
MPTPLPLLLLLLLLLPLPGLSIIFSLEFVRLYCSARCRPRSAAANKREAHEGKAPPLLRVCNASSTAAHNAAALCRCRSLPHARRNGWFRSGGEAPYWELWPVVLWLSL